MELSYYDQHTPHYTPSHRTPHKPYTIHHTLFNNPEHIALIGTRDLCKILDHESSLVVFSYLHVGLRGIQEVPHLLAVHLIV